MKLSFRWTQTNELAQYVAGLVRAGVCFKMAQDEYGIDVTLTGGF